ncbi:MAG: hypothetical protein BWY87_00592 [Deltaproteobacteria bacterium ADurb.Bin510]|nr:MAG: hypothetical protein BWY87_00592 [Deltaproteobacteria bacterium ADurb.Bin510]
MGYEGPDADHVDIEFLKQLDVGRDVVQRLTRQSDQKARAGLEAQALELSEAVEPVRERALGVQAGIDVRIGCLEAQQVAVGPGLFERGVGRRLELAQGERDHEASLSLDAPNEFEQVRELEARILAGLQHHGAKAGGLDLPRAGQGLPRLRPQ